MSNSQENRKNITFSVLGAGGNQGLTTLDSLINNVWNTDFENGLLDKRDEIARIEAVERDRNSYDEIIQSLSDDSFDFEDRWRLISEEDNSMLYKHEDLDVEIEFINSDAADYLQNDFQGGVVYDGVWTEERANVARSLSDRIDSEASFLSESSAELFEKPTGVAKKEINRLMQLGIPLSENQVEMFSAQKKSTIQDIRESETEVIHIETYRMSEPVKMIGGDDKDERNLLRHNAGSMHDKGVHDWGKILSTLAATEQLDEKSEIELDKTESVYRKAIAELEDRDVVFEEDGGWYSNKSLENPSSNQRINDGFSRAKGKLDGVSIDVVTSLTGWEDQTEERINELEQRFDLDSHTVKLVEGVNEEAIDNISDSNLVYGRAGGKEVRTEYIKTDQAEYLVSTGGEMYTLKKENDEITVMAYGGTDWHAEFLEEGIDALVYGEEMTVDIESSMRTNRIMEDVTGELYRKAQGNPVRVDTTRYEGLEEIILDDIGEERREKSMRVPVSESEKEYKSSS